MPVFVEYELLMVVVFPVITAFPAKAWQIDDIAVYLWSWLSLIDGCLLSMPIVRHMDMVEEVVCVNDRSQAGGFSSC